jgi:hypothetical protein
MQGTTQITHWTDTITTDNTSVSHTLTTGEAGAINTAALNDLRLRFVLTAVS